MRSMVATKDKTRLNYLIICFQWKKTRFVSIGENILHIEVMKTKMKMSRAFNKSFMKLQFISRREKLYKSFTATNQTEPLLRKNIW